LHPLSKRPSAHALGIPGSNRPSQYPEKTEREKLASGITEQQLGPSLGLDPVFHKESAYRKSKKRVLNNLMMHEPEGLVVWSVMIGLSCFPCRRDRGRTDAFLKNSDEGLLTLDADLERIHVSIAQPNKGDEHKDRASQDLIAVQTSRPRGKNLLRLVSPPRQTCLNA
jgi:hypothetical protein